MSTENDLTFDENKYKIKSRVILGQAEVPGMAKFLLRKGMVKSEGAANSILVGLIIISLSIAAYVFAIFVFDVKLFDNTPVQTQEQIQSDKERMLQISQQIKNNTNNTQNPQ